MSINEAQDEIIEEFSILAGDRESTIFYIMELGQKLPEFPIAYQIDENLVKGCQSKVWLATELNDGRVTYLADSNTEITKGLISLLIRVYAGRKPDEIINSTLYFIDKIGMGSLIGSQRSNGFASMTKQMRLYALAYQEKIRQAH